MVANGQAYKRGADLSNHCRCERTEKTALQEAGEVSFFQANVRPRGHENVLTYITISLYVFIRPVYPFVFIFCLSTSA